MAAHSRIEHLAREIWSEAGVYPRFPRDLGKALVGGFDVATVPLASLSTTTIDIWLRERGRRGLPGRQQRKLDGCLLARRGHGLIFVDSGLPAERWRFVEAHEFAHFYLHHLVPRRLALSRFGAAITPVLDGQRPASHSERLAGCLAGYALSHHEEFFSRDGRGRPAGTTTAVENDADMLACEVLAPAAILLRHGSALDELEAAAKAGFGLPADIAAGWARFVHGQAPQANALVTAIAEKLRKNG